MSRRHNNITTTLKCGPNKAGHFGQSFVLQHSLHCWETWITGHTGWVWKSADIPPFWDKDNTDSRPAQNDSLLQQMRLEAWQQRYRCPATAGLHSNHSQAPNDIWVKQQTVLKAKWLNKNSSRSKLLCKTVIWPGILGVWEWQSMFR